MYSSVNAYNIVFFMLYEYSIVIPVCQTYNAELFLFYF